MQVGIWYSAPAAGECAEGQLPSAGGAACYWARNPEAYFTMGHSLLDEGLDTREHSAWGIENVQSNDGVVERAFALRMAAFAGAKRCCGC